MQDGVHTSIFDLEQDDEDRIDEHDDGAPQINLESLTLGSGLVRDDHNEHEERESQRAVYGELARLVRQKK
jgi:hypothetical protein